MRSFYHSAAVLVLAVAIPGLSHADVSGTATLTANQTLSFDTGATGSSGGDVLWTGTSLSFQSSATGYFYAYGSGSTTYGTLNQTMLQAFSALFSKSSIAASSLTANAIFAVHTNGGYYAKAMVTAVNGTSIALQFTTYGASAAASGPTITAVQNGYSFISAGLPNYGIAPGTIFIVRGTGLADPSAPVVLQSSAAPGLKTTLYGASATVTVNGTTTTPVFYYALPTQLAMVLPAATPVGTGTITVTYSGKSATASMTVVQSAPGILTYAYSNPDVNTNIAKITDPNTGALFNYTNSAQPGNQIVFWGSGLGGFPNDSDTTYSSARQATNNPVQIYIGGVQATNFWAGDSGYPGLNQLNVYIPSTVTPGCNVSVAIVSGNMVSNITTIPVAVGGGVCSDTLLGVNGTQLSSRGGQTNVKSGSVGVIHMVDSTSGQTTTTDVAAANFQSISGNYYDYTSGNVISVGSCMVTQTVGSGTSTVTSTGLDAGTITVQNSGGTKATLQTVPLTTGSYYALLPTGFFPSTGSTFAFAGTGGKDVGAFTATINLNNPMTWTNTSASASVTRSSGQLIQWTGGTAGTFALIMGTSSGTVSGQTVSGSYVCYAPVSAGQFTVPSWALLTLPAGTGTTAVENGSAYSTFTASGLDTGYAYGAVMQSVSTTFK